MNRSRGSKIRKNTGEKMELKKLIRQQRSEGEAQKETKAGKIEITK